MQRETSSDADRECKDLIGESYEAAYEAAHAAGGWFSGIDQVWEKVQKALARKGALELCTTGTEDSFAQDILGEVFEEACRAAEEDGHVGFASEYVDYQQLWERLCAVLGVQV